MYHQDENYDVTRSESLQPKKLSSADTKNLSQDKVEAHKKQIERLFVRLIILGLGLGFVLSIGTVIVMNKFGLIKYEREKPEPPVDKPIELPDVDRS
jgi:hypothetical protein